MKNRKIIDFIREYAPEDTALSFDNVGLMCGSLDAETEKVIFCMDFTEEVLEKAVFGGARLVITHHPFIFNPIRSVTEDCPKGVLISEAIRNNITVYSAHTNLDFAKNGINDTLIETLGIEEYESDASGFHRFGDLFQEIKFSEFLEFARFSLNVKKPRVVLPVGKTQNDLVRRVGVSCGAFDGEYDWIDENDVHVLVTGELKHHEAIELKERGVFVVAAGHYESEQPGVERLAEIVGKEFGIETETVTECNPFTEL